MLLFCVDRDDDEVTAVNDDPDAPPVPPVADPPAVGNGVVPPVELLLDTVDPSEETELPPMEGIPLRAAVDDDGGATDDDGAVGAGGDGSGFEGSLPEGGPAR
jgi:hypothetical protein